VSRVAVRYSKALFELALEHKLVETVQADLAMISEIHRENPDFYTALNNPLIDEFIKAKMLGELFQKDINALTFNFLQLLSRKKRSAFLLEIIDHFNESVLDYQGILPATLFYAEQLSNEQIDEIKSRIEKMIGKSILLSKQIDPSIVGGFIVRIRDTVIDLSIKTQLNKLHAQLTHG
jgi:F-type H+-transporting ATPase subunit delta